MSALTEENRVHRRAPRGHKVCGLGDRATAVRLTSSAVNVVLGVKRRRSKMAAASHHNNPKHGTHKLPAGGAIGAEFSRLHGDTEQHISVSLFFLLCDELNRRYCHSLRGPDGLDIRAALWTGAVCHVTSRELLTPIKDDDHEERLRS